MSDERKHKLSDEEVDQIAEKVLNKLSVHGLLGSDRHWAEHEWLKRYIEKHTDSKDRRQRIMERIVGSVGVAMTLGFLMWVGNAIIVQMSIIMKKLL